MCVVRKSLLLFTSAVYIQNALHNSFYDGCVHMNPGQTAGCDITSIRT